MCPLQALAYHHLAVPLTDARARDSRARDSRDSRDARDARDARDSRDARVRFRHRRSHC